MEDKEDKEDKKEEDDQRPAVLLSSQLLLKRSVYEVSLHPGVLTWTRAHLPSRLGHSVPVSELISVRELEVASSTSTSPCSCTSMCSTTTSSDSSPSRNSTTGTSMCTSRCTSGAKSSRRWQKIPQRDEEDSPHAFTVSYVQRARRAAWRLRDVTFLCADAALSGLWVRTLTEQLSALAQRPRRLLVYINPLSGKRRGERIYRHKVAPLFSSANISTSVIVTQHANHARDHLRTEAELQNYDGVVCVGGDGMFSEVMHGLVLRTQRDQGRDHHHPDQDLAQTGLRIGIIPAGSTDCICFATVGANDPVTSSLHIIVGDCQPMDVCSVHHGDAFLRYSVSLLGYGFYGDVLSDSERRRWMGPARYDISGVKKFLSHRYYEGTVSYLPASDVLGTPRDRAPCRTGCMVCQYNRPLEEEKLEMEESHDGLVCVSRTQDVSSSFMKPTWTTFIASEASEKSLHFSLKLMTDDWQFERPSAHYFLGDEINIEASVAQFHHSPLRVFADHCVATLIPNTNTVPRYAFLDNFGCLMDSMLIGSSSHILPRLRQDDKLRIQLEAFRFQQESNGVIYITCSLRATTTAEPVTATSKACSFTDGWREASGFHNRCSCCETSCGSGGPMAQPLGQQWESVKAVGPFGVDERPLK